MKLSVAIICKNEEMVIAKCLESVKDADEIIVCDTGSTDNTVKIASQYAAVNTDYLWKDNFSEARNFAASFCAGDWILSIDADEVLLTPIDNIRAQIVDAEVEGYTGLYVHLMYSAAHKHSMIRVFKSGLKWTGAVHEYVTCNACPSNIIIQYGKSPAHLQDPDRSLRILEKIPEKSPREMFYYANELYDRGRLPEALDAYQAYVKASTFREEKADANLRIARCLFSLQRGDEARDACLQAILGNPEFKEALTFMAEMSWEKQAVTWRRYADSATNDGVIFIRNPELYSGSYPANRGPIMEIVKGLNPKTILEIGTGSGYYGELIHATLPRTLLTGIEVFEKYRNEKWDNYKQVIIKDVRDIPSLSASLVLMVDVLEHFTREEGAALLARLKGKVLVSVPRNYEQDAVHGNIHQKHLSQWTEEDFPGWEDYSNELSVIMVRR